MSNHTEPQTFIALLNSPDIGGTIIMADPRTFLNILMKLQKTIMNVLSFPWPWIRAAEWRAVSGLVRDVKGQTLDLGEDCLALIQKFGCSVRSRCRCL